MLVGDGFLDVGSGRARRVGERKLAPLSSMSASMNLAVGLPSLSTKKTCGERGGCRVVGAGPAPASLAPPRHDVLVGATGMYSALASGLAGRLFT